MVLCHETLTIQNDQMQELQWDGKKASLEGDLPDADAKVCEPNQNTEKATRLLAKVYDKYGYVGKVMLDIDREVDDRCALMEDTAMVIEAAEKTEKTEVAAMKLGSAWERHRNVAVICDKVLGEVNVAMEEWTSTVS